MIGVPPVSYTHLDVYKRQVLGVNSTHHQAVLEPADIFAATGRSPDGIVEVMELKPEYMATVSYTHLDVYKRQQHDRPIACKVRRPLARDKDLIE